MPHHSDQSSLGITVLGSTGSIGLSTLDVIKRNPRRFHVVALTANRSVDRLFEQCLEYQPLYAVLPRPQDADELGRRLRAAGSRCEVLNGPRALEEVASLPECDAVMAAIVGAAGLLPSLAAARAGKRVLLANKEALVMSGKLFINAVNQHGATLLPIDSEHNAIFQCLPPGFGRDLHKAGVERILLTASGGPFRAAPVASLAAVTPEQACAHPNWVMGRKISVDSATMMNKGLEVIEAHWLFNAPSDRIEVVLHPQSVIHSMVSYSDGSVIAELGNPDMRTPIAHALAWPERIESGVAPLDLFKVAQLNFEKPDLQRFPCLKLARDALEAGGAAATILNAANEVAVEAFLERQIGYPDIPAIIEFALEKTEHCACDSLEDVLVADEAARRMAAKWIASRPQFAAV